MIRLRQPVNDTPEAVRAGVLFGIWCGLMATLMGCLHLEHLLPPVARLTCWLVGIVGLAGAVLVAELYRRRGGSWAPEGWLGGFVLAGFVIFPLLWFELAEGAAADDAEQVATEEGT